MPGPFVTLAELAARHGTDKLLHGYCTPYEQHLGPFRDRPFRLLEIGVERGASLRAWADYFPHATIIGVDIDPADTVNTDRVSTVVADINRYQPGGPVDVVIDDGSHAAVDICAAHQLLWPHINPGGWYVIEDLSTQFFPLWGGSSAGSIATDLLDGIVHRLIGQLPDQSGAVTEIHLYPRIVFLRKANIS
jgi:hypothetical protein